MYTITSTLQLGKPRFGERKTLVQGHVALREDAGLGDTTLSVLNHYAMASPQQEKK